MGSVSFVFVVFCFLFLLLLLSWFCVVHVAATSSDDQRYHSLDALLRRNHENVMTGALYDDDDYGADGCISVLIYDNDDCSGPVKKLVRAPVKAESNCGR